MVPEGRWLWHGLHHVPSQRKMAHDWLWGNGGHLGGEGGHVTMRWKKEPLLTTKDGFFFFSTSACAVFCRFSPAGAHWDNIFLQMSTNNVTDNATKQAADYLPVFREPAKIAPTANNNEETRMDHVSITLQSYLIRKMPALYYIIVFQESHTARGRNVATEQNTPGLNCISC